MKKQTKCYDIFSSRRNQRTQNMGLYDFLNFFFLKNWDALNSAFSKYFSKQINSLLNKIAQVHLDNIWTYGQK